MFCAGGSQSGRKAIEHYEDRNGESSAPLVVSDVKMQGPTEAQARDDVEDLVPETVGYVMTITDDGEPREYIGKAHTSQGVPEIHGRVAEKKLEFAQSLSQRHAIGSMGSSVGGSIGTPGPFMDYTSYRHGNTEEAVSPYGALYQSGTSRYDFFNGGVYWVIDSTYE